MSIFQKTSRLHLKELGLGLYILSLTPGGYAIPESLWQTYTKDQVDDFWKEAQHELTETLKENDRRRREEIESWLLRLGAQDGPISYHIRDIYPDVASPAPVAPRGARASRNPPAPSSDSIKTPFQLPSSVTPSNEIRFCAVKIFWPNNLWQHPWDQAPGLVQASNPPQAPTPAQGSNPVQAQPHRISLPSNFLLRNYNPASPKNGEQMDISPFQHKQGFFSIVLLPPLSGDAAPQVLVIRARIWKSNNEAERFIQKLRSRPKIEMADSGPNNDYLAVLRALKDLQSQAPVPRDLFPQGDAGEPNRLRNLPETFNAEHPSGEDLNLVYELRKELQLSIMRALMAKHLECLRAYVAKENPSSQDIVELNEKERQFARDIKDCVIKTGIPRRYLDNLQRVIQLRQVLHMGQNELISYVNGIRAYAPEGDAAYQLNEARDIPELAKIIGGPILILGKHDDRSTGGKFFPLEGGPETHADTPKGRAAIEEHLRNPAVLKIYRQGPGHSGVILFDPPPESPPAAGD
ncbi:MAG: hypothetical protein LBD54_01000 [Puniceicoccales bacterium]|jgi:hypothetical protein|nr:hypothetical protein [Puniceicoccales bacterium]